MLVVFNLGWERFDIDRRVSAANRQMNGLAEDRGAGHFVIFNLASLGAGEKVIDRTERREKAREKDPDFDKKIAAMRIVPEEKDYPLNDTVPDQRTMDLLRMAHHQTARLLDRDEHFKAYRDAAEMLNLLKVRGHSLAAVFTEESKAALLKLKRARTLDYFEDRVYGSDSLERNKDDLTSVAVYKQALHSNKTASYDSIIVADNLDGIAEARAVKPMAVIGYLDPYLEEKVLTEQLKEMRYAGATFAVVGGHGVSSIPEILVRNRGLPNFKEAADRRCNGDSGPSYA